MPWPQSLRAQGPNYVDLPALRNLPPITTEEMAEAFDVAAIGEFRGTITFTGEIDPTNGDPIVLIDGETIYRQRPFDVPESVRISYVPADPERDN